MSLEDALGVMQDGKRLYFDPKVVDTLISILEINNPEVSHILKIIRGKEQFNR